MQDQTFRRCYVLRRDLAVLPSSWRRLLLVFCRRLERLEWAQKKKPTARFASGGGLETLLVLLAVSDLAGSARSLSLNNHGGRGRLGNGRHRHDAGANRDGERQTHERKPSTEPN